MEIGALKVRKTALEADINAALTPLIQAFITDVDGYKPEKIEVFIAPCDMQDPNMRIVKVRVVMAI